MAFIFHNIGIFIFFIYYGLQECFEDFLKNQNFQILIVVHASVCAKAVFKGLNFEYGKLGVTNYTIIIQTGNFK